MTVVWTAPGEIGRSAITSYDLQYLRADAADKSGVNWTPVNAIWTSGELSYELTGLDRGRSYDLQVRAVNASSASPWSPPMTGATLAIAPESPAIESIQPRNGKLIVEWSVPGFDGGAPISRYDVRHVLSGDLSDPDPPWTILSSVGARIAPGQYRYTVSGLVNDASYTVQVRAANRDGDGEWSDAATGTPDAENTNPAFLEGETASRSLREDVAVGTVVGAAFLAVDADSDPLKYTVSGEIGPFSFDPATAQLRVAETLDYETTTTYTIKLQVKDGQDGSGNSDTAVDATIDVTITVEDLDEGFEISGAASAFIMREENTTGVLETYTATDPEGKDLTWSTGGTDADAFTIAEGALSFALTPDYEAPLDTDGDNLYSLGVSASDGVNVSTVAVAVGDVNELPEITGPSKFTIAENTVNHEETYTATDPEARPLVWDVLDRAGVHGPDYGDFDFLFDDKSDRSGRLRLRHVPDFESPTDADSNNVYEVTLYSNDWEGPWPQWLRFDVQVTVTNVNEAPLIISGPFSFSYPEDRTNKKVGAYTAADPEGDTLTWSLEGTDAADFEISDDGAVTFREQPDYEAKHEYAIIVRATDDDLLRPLSHTRDLTVSVTNVNERPVVMGTKAIAHAENEGRALAGASYSATDPEGANITWSVGGIDKGFFAISSGGVLSFAAEPDFDIKGDRNSDNIYEVTVQATEEDDGDALTRELTGELDVRVTLSDHPEPPEIIGPKRVADFPENSLTTKIVGRRYTAEDPEGAGVTWSDLSGNDAADFDLSNSGELTFKRSPNFEMKDEYSVRLNAYDGRLPGSLDVTVTIANVNEPPVVRRRSGMGAFSIEENSRTTVGSFDADDPENDDVTWSLATTGNHGRFEIDATSGVLSFKDPPDYESSDLGSGLVRAYNVTVRATEADDGDPLTRELPGSLPVTVRITNVNEAPVITGPERVDWNENTAGTIATYRATDPEGVAVTWSLQGGAGVFMISSAGALSFASAPNYEDQTEHTVTVRVSDGTNTPDHPVTVTVTDVDEVEELTLSDPRPLIDVPYTASFEQGTGDVVQSPTWQWSRSTSRNSGHVAIIGATAATYRPVTADSGYYLRVTASYNDGHGARTLQATSELATAATSASNEPPAFPVPLFTGGATGLSVRENATAGTLVGTAPQATDPESKPLRYSLAVTGFTTDPPFKIEDPSSRQIRVTQSAELNAELNHEMRDTYRVTVTVKDDFNVTDTATFDISIEDVNERPVAVDDPSVTTLEDMPVTFDVRAAAVAGVPARRHRRGVQPRRLRGR